MKVRAITRRRLMGAALTVAGAVVTATFTAPMAASAVVAAAGPLPALDVKAAPEKTVYQPGETVVVTVSITNVGTAAAKNVREVSGAVPPNPSQPSDPEGDDGIIWSTAAANEVGFGNGFALAVGETKIVTRRGVLDAWAYNHGQASVRWTFKPDGEQAAISGARNSASFTVRVPGAVGDVTGQVCVGSQFEVLVCEYVSPGGPVKGVAGVKVTLLNPGDKTKTVATTTTAANGTFTFKGVPAGTQSFGFTAPKGWHMVGGPNYKVLVVAGADASKSKLLAGARKDTDPLGPTTVRNEATPAAGAGAADGTGSGTGLTPVISPRSASASVETDGNAGLSTAVMGTVLVLVGAAGYAADRRRTARRRAAAAMPATDSLPRAA